MHLANRQEHKTGKALKCPAARLTGSVRPVSAGLSFHLKKREGSDAWRINLIFMQKANRTVLNLTNLPDLTYKTMFSLKSPL
jgi:hypothetical protein